MTRIEDADPTDVGGRVAAGGLTLLTARLLVRVVGVLSTALVARLLTPSDFGILALALAVVGLVDVFSDLQLSAALIRMRDIEAKHFDTAFTLQLMRGCLVGGIIFGSAEFAAGAMHQPALADVFRVLAAAPLAAAFVSPRLILFERKIDFRREFFVSLVVTVAGAGVTAGLAYDLQSYWALIYGAIATAAIGSIVTHIAAPYRPRLSLKHWRDFVGFGGWLTAANIVAYFNYKTDVVLVGRQLGSLTLGHYTMADKLSQLATNEFAQPFVRAVYPGLAAVATDEQRLKGAYYKSQAVILSAALPIGVGMALCARDIVFLVVGSQWAPAASIVQIMAPVMAFGLLASGVQALVMTMGHTRALLFRNLANLLIRLPLLLLGFSFFGLLGVLWARVAASVFLTLMTLQLATRYTQDWLGAPVARSWRSLAACFFMVGAVLALRNGASQDGGSFAVALRLSQCVLLGGTVYVGAHYALWRLVGRPDGAERFFVRRVERLHHFARRMWSAHAT